MNYLDSQILFGGYNTKLMRNSSEIKWMNLPTKNYWAVSISDAMFGDTSFFTSSPGKMVEFNPNQLYISIPKEEFKKLVALFIKDEPSNIDSCKIYSCIRNTLCSEVPDISLKFRIGENQEMIEIPSS